MTKIKNVFDYLKFEEGFRAKPYYCTGNKLSIGYGHNLEDNHFTAKELKVLCTDYSSYHQDGAKITAVRDFNKSPITEYHAEYLLMNSIARIVTVLDSKIASWNELSQVRKSVLISMAYQMGVDGLLSFKNAIKALDNGNYKLSAIEILDSKFAIKDTPIRAKRCAFMMEHDRWPEVN